MYSIESVGEGMSLVKEVIWIPCATLMPSSDIDEVIATMGRGAFAIRYNHIRKVWYKDGMGDLPDDHLPITHWMPFPPDPEPSP